MALGKETGVPKIIPIRRESMKLAWPARGAFSSTDRGESIFVAREQDRLPAPSGADSKLLAGLLDASPSAVDELLRQYQGKILNLAMPMRPRWGPRGTRGSPRPGPK